MSVTRHHAEWLSLIEVSGPFLSMPVLMRVFPLGLDPREPEKAKELRLAYEEWLEKPNAPGRHQAWVRFVLSRFLEFPENLILGKQSIPYGVEAHMTEYGEVLRPDYAVVAPPGHVSAGNPHLLLHVYPPGQNLDGPVAGKHWKASPATRITELLHAVDITLGMITNGEQWMLVYAPRGETSGYTSWYAGIWQEEPITLRAFSSVMHARRFFGVAESDTLQSLLKESSQDQQEVTDQLGLQVRRAVEVLVQAFDRTNQESGRQLLHDIEPKELYDAALTVMMRLVFLFSAEERGMLRLGEPLYDENYAASTLREQLREAADQHGEEILERRMDAWSRLLATFRAIYGGIAHETLRLPAYGGTLFDPDRYPFLEGRPARTCWRRSPATPPNINNRVVLHLLESLQLLQMKVPGGGPAEARRLSFRALDIEQIGHVYEGLLDHTAIRAVATVLGLQGTKNNEPEIPLVKLEQLRLEGEEPLIEYLKGETKRSEPALRRASGQRDEINDQKLLIACGQDVRLRDRIKPFAGLLRMDSFEMPVVILPESVYVTEGKTRRSTGTHYTPKSLTEPIVQHTLEPLVYEGPDEGRSKDQWKLRSPKEILSLGVCDMTMGSGAFLVQSCRYLAERLAEAWENTEQASPGSFVVTPDGELSTGDSTERLLPKDPEERLVIARRAVADRCLYGVDINSMAVEMAKLSLWLVTMQKDRPFTFLDHALKCGDSLLGVSRLDQIENFSLRPDVKQITFATANLLRYLEEAANKRRQLEALPSESARLAEKIRLHVEAEAATSKVKAIADVIIILELKGFKGKTYEEARSREAEKVQWLIQQDMDATSEETVKNEKHPSALIAYAKEQLDGRFTFHWLLEFPEIFARGGFDAFVGNPPFSAVRLFAAQLGQPYARHLFVQTTEASGNVDLSVFFLRRIHALSNPLGCAGVIVTNSIGEGDNRRAGLDVVTSTTKIYRAWKSLRWPGSANVYVSLVHFSCGGWNGLLHLDDKTCQAISSELKPQAMAPDPKKLLSLHHLYFRGSDWNGEGFVVDEDFVNRQLDREPASASFLFPLLNANDYCEHPTQLPSRWIVYFGKLPLESVILKVPDLVEALKKRVFEERSMSKDSRLRQNWWIFRRPTVELYEASWKEKEVFVNAFTAKYICFAHVNSNQVFANALNVFPSLDYQGFSVLQSSIHNVWARDRGSYLADTLRYTPSDCFETFPMPLSNTNLSETGSKYHELRRQDMQRQHIGLTKIYNQFHDQKEKSLNIVRLRELHLEMDQAVATAYGWSDLDLDHGFHKTTQGIRFTISEPARRIVLDRLLTLNHERYEEEVKAGLYEKKAAKGSGKRRKNKASSDKKTNQYELFKE